MKPKSLKAIFFDIDDTIQATTEFAEKARRASIAEMIRFGLKVPEEEAFHELREVINEFSSNYQYHFDKLLLRFPSSAYADVNPAILIAAGVVGYHQAKFRLLRPYPDVIEVFEILSKTPLTLGIISAGLAVKQAEKLIRLDLYKYLNPKAIFISDQIGISKPNIKLYLKACESLNLDPTEVMYIGDNPTNDIDPTNQIGMITVRNRRATQHSFLEGKTEADYEINDFYDLLAILKRDYGLKTGSIDTKS